MKAGVRVLHLDGLHLDVAIEAASIARRIGVATVLDAGTFRDGVEGLLPLIDHLVVSETFVSQSTDDKNPDVALQDLASYGAQAVTMTCGSKGSYSYQQGERIFHQPAFDVDAVDTTGCGDVFHGGYIYGLLQAWSLPQRVRFAAACAALKTRALGGRSAIP
ncbi:MAG: sugar kinase, partial [Gammaproteobacteria bacterium]|nr:sugar kinase [Gammaproteobacteria bacterium]NIQ11478.1 sugar kinase [Gammaproteobacteria bacterium]NIR25958.1 sugar kinase [Gammaproteobacteria bacterium]NIY18974.1 sugar kinase [Gammaproteobacteria bacterium]